MLMFSWIFAMLGTTEIALTQPEFYYRMCGVFNLIGNLYNMYVVGHDLFKDS